MAFINTKDSKMPGFDPIPGGRYIAEIKALVWKDNSKGTGEYLELDCIIIKGDERKSRFWERMNLIHDNPKAVEMALKEFKELTIAALGEDKEFPSKKAVIKSLLGKRVGAILTVKEEKDQKPKNEVTGWFDPDDAPKEKKGKKKKPEESPEDPWDKPEKKGKKGKGKKKKGKA